MGLRADKSSGALRTSADVLGSIEEATAFHKSGHEA